MSRRTLRGSLLSLCALLALVPAARAAETYGAGVTLTEPTSIAKILAEPDAWVGKRVRVEGKVTDVCPMKGCWMEVAESADARIRVKVDDGVIVFPTDATGKQAAAEGVVEAIPMSREQYVGWMSHLAEEKGETFDASAVGDGPFRLLQLRGEGARLE